MELIITEHFFVFCRTEILWSTDLFQDYAATFLFPFSNSPVCYCSCNLNKLALLHQSYNFSYSLGFDINVNTTVTQKKKQGSKTWNLVYAVISELFVDLCLKKPMANKVTDIMNFLFMLFSIIFKMKRFIGQSFSKVKEFFQQMLLPCP